MLCVLANVIPARFRAGLVAPLPSRSGQAVFLSIMNICVWLAVPARRVGRVRRNQSEPLAINVCRVVSWSCATFLDGEEKRAFRMGYIRA